MILEEEKRTYKEVADLYPNWKDIDRNELCREYVKLKEQHSQLADPCLAAIICNFWYLIEHNFYKQQVIIAQPEDIHGWLVDSILGALKDHVWDNPNNSLYQDEKGPEKAINVIFKCTSVNFFVAEGRDKRKTLQWSASIDELEDNEDSTFEVEDENSIFIDEELLTAQEVRDYIAKAFKEKHRIKAFALYLLLKNDKGKGRNAYSIVMNKDKLFSIQYGRLAETFQSSLNKEFAKEFAEYCKLDEEEVYRALLLCAEYIDNYFNYYLEAIIEVAKQDDELKQILLEL